MFPAWVVRIADRLEWNIEVLDTQNTLDGDGDPIPIVLSLIIPAYNEEDRIPMMLHEAVEYLNSINGIKLLQRLQLLTKEMNVNNGSNNHQDARQTPLKVEWLVVNDGSKDHTCQVVRDTISKFQRNDAKTNATTRQNDWKIISLTQNSGKGAAVKTGMQLAKGSFHLMVDADGATAFGPGLEYLVEAIETKLLEHSQTTRNNVPLAAFGSRAHLQEVEATAHRSLVRTLLMKAFHFFVSLFVSSKIHDTQCGFKLFPKYASRAVFETLHLRRWAFDTEVVLLCEQLRIEILEVGVPWHEVEGSKLSTSKLALALVSITMLRDMICVRTCYNLGIWRVGTNATLEDTT